VGASCSFACPVTHPKPSASAYRHRPSSIYWTVILGNAFPVGNAGNWTYASCNIA
jgi:hypothetical protein